MVMNEWSSRRGVRRSGRVFGTGSDGEISFENDCYKE